MTEERTYGGARTPAAAGDATAFPSAHCPDHGNQRIVGYLGPSWQAVRVRLACGKVLGIVCGADTLRALEGMR